LEKIEACTQSAASLGARMIVFPELTITGIYKDTKVWEGAEPLSGPALRAVRAMARGAGMLIGVGLSEKTDGKPFNTYCVINPDGEVAGVYRKNHIPKLEIPFWQGHSGRPVFTVLGAKMGVSICWDNKYPELLEHYRKQEVRLVLMPHAWDSDALDASGNVIDYDSMEEIVRLHQQTGHRVWKTHDQMREEFYSYIPQLARENRFFALFVNQAGQPHPSIHFAGPTFAVDPLGKIIVETRNGAEQVLLADLDV
jgi:predicted amidohydrolase